MDEVDILLTLAEISVAFTGFAALASILGRRYSRDHPELDAIRLRNAVDFSLTAVGLSLFPILLVKLNLPPPIVWRASSLLFLAALVGLFLAATLRARALTRANVPYSRSFSVVSQSFGVAIGLALAANTLGFTGNALFPTYYGALLGILVFAALFFIRILASLLAPSLDS